MKNSFLHKKAGNISTKKSIMIECRVKIWLQLVQKYLVFQIWFLKRDRNIRNQALKTRIELMYYSTVISPNNDCVLRDSVGFIAYIIFQHKQKWNSIESCCTFAGLIKFWTAIATKQTGLQFRNYLEAITIWANTIEKTLIHIQHDQVRLSSYHRPVQDCLAFVPWKQWKTVFYTRKQETT